MLTADLKDIVKAEVISSDDGSCSVAYTTRDGRECAERVGSKSEAEAIVKQIAMSLNTATDELGLFPRDIAAS